VIWAVIADGRRGLCPAAGVAFNAARRDQKSALGRQDKDAPKTDARDCLPAAKHGPTLAAVTSINRPGGASGEKPHRARCAVVLGCRDGRPDGNQT
jgi:hypothetical protein